MGQAIKALVLNVKGSWPMQQDGVKATAQWCQLCGHAIVSGRDRAAAAALVAHIEPLLVTREDAARLLSLSTKEIDRVRAKGDLVARRHGSRVLFTLDELRRFAADLPTDERGRS